MAGEPGAVVFFWPPPRKTSPSPHGSALSPPPLWLRFIPSPSWGRAREGVVSGCPGRPPPQPSPASGGGGCLSLPLRRTHPLPHGQHIHPLPLMGSTYIPSPSAPAGPLPNPPPQSGEGGPGSGGWWFPCHLPLHQAPSPALPRKRGRESSPLWRKGMLLPSPNRAQFLFYTPQGEHGVGRGISLQTVPHPIRHSARP
jgi:hypothetical protein